MTEKRKKKTTKTRCQYERTIFKKCQAPEKKTTIDNDRRLNFKELKE